MGPEILGLLIPLSAVILGIGVAFWSIYWDHQKKRLQYQERQLMIEKGMTPPPVLPDQPKKQVTPEDCLRRGTVLLFLGLGFGVGYFVLANTGGGPPAWIVGVAGAIVGFLGLGYLTYYLIVRRSSQEEADTTRMPL